MSTNGELLYKIHLLERQLDAAVKIIAQTKGDEEADRVRKVVDEIDPWSHLFWERAIGVAMAQGVLDPQTLIPYGVRVTAWTCHSRPMELSLVVTITASLDALPSGSEMTVRAEVVQNTGGEEVYVTEIQAQSA